MTDRYVWDSAPGPTHDGTSWNNAYQTVAAVDSVANAGDLVLVRNTHTEGHSGSALTIDFTGGTEQNPVLVMSADSGDNYVAGATIDVTTSHDLTINGFVKMQGITLDAGDGIDLCRSTNDCQWYRDMTFASGGIVLMGAAENSIEFYESSFSGSTSASQGLIWINQESRAKFIDCTFTEDNSGDTAFRVTYDNASCEVIGCDLTDYQYLTTDWGDNGRIEFVFKRCKLHGSWEAVKSGSLNGPARILVQDCDDGTITKPPMGINYLANYAGYVEQQDTIFRNDGADDDENTNGFSMKMVSNANARENVHSIACPIWQWVDPDATISGATAQGIFSTTRITALNTTPTELDDYGVDTPPNWTGSGPTTKYRLQATLTNGSTLTVHIWASTTLYDDDVWLDSVEPDQVGGVALAEVHLAKPSTTIYVCPLAVVA